MSKLDDFVGKRKAHINTDELDDEECEVVEFNDFGVVYEDSNGDTVFVPYNKLNWCSV
jgi:hypothetical protein